MINPFLEWGPNRIPYICIENPTRQEAETLRQLCHDNKNLVCSPHSVLQTGDNLKYLRITPLYLTGLEEDAAMSKVAVKLRQGTNLTWGTDPFVLDAIKETTTFEVLSFQEFSDKYMLKYINMRFWDENNAPFLIVKPDTREQLKSLIDLINRNSKIPKNLMDTSLMISPSDKFLRISSKRKGLVGCVRTISEITSFLHGEAEVISAATFLKRYYHPTSNTTERLFPIY